MSLRCKNHVHKNDILKGEDLEVLRGDREDELMSGHDLVLLADEAHVGEEIGTTHEEAREQRRQLRVPAPPVSHLINLVIRSSQELTRTINQNPY